MTCIYMFQSGERIIVLLSSLCTPLSLPHTPPHLPHHSDSWKQNSSDSFCCFSLSQLPHSPTPPFPSPPHCRNRICRNHSKARYNLLLAVHNTPSHSHPLSQSHKVPCGWTNHTWNIISASYSSILWTAPFYGAMDLTPAWSHSHQSVQEERGWVGGVGGECNTEKPFVFTFLCLHLCRHGCFDKFIFYPNIDFPRWWLHCSKKEEKKTLLREHTSSSQELHQQTHKKLFHGALLPVVPLLSLCNPHIWTSNSSSFIIYTSQ